MEFSWRCLAQIDDILVFNPLKDLRLEHFSRLAERLSISVGLLFEKVSYLLPRMKVFRDMISLYDVIAALVPYFSRSASRALITIGARRPAYDSIEGGGIALFVAIHLLGGPLDLLDD